MGVGNGERIAAIAITRHEVALEVQTLELVRCSDHREGLGVGRVLRFFRLGFIRPARLSTCPIALAAGHSTFGLIRSNLALSFLASHDGNSEDFVLDLGRRCMRTSIRLAGQIQQTLRPNFVVTLDPLISCGARYALLMTQVGNGHLFLLIARQKLQALIHGAYLFPGHKRIIVRKANAEKSLDLRHGVKYRAGPICKASPQYTQTASTLSMFKGSPFKRKVKSSKPCATAF